MMKTVTVGGVLLGAGRPKMILPVSGGTAAQIEASARQAAAFKPDLAEWRADGLGRPLTPAEVAAHLAGLRALLGPVPLLFTWRSRAEGGAGEATPLQYREMVLAAARSGAELVDVEYTAPDSAALTREARQAGAAVVASSHNFAATPPRGQLLARLCAMETEQRADIAKIAVMPKTPEDVLALLGATADFAARDAIPCITMSMGPLGSISRVCGETFGSAATFGSAGQASAPGQLPAASLRTLLETLHTALGEP